MRHILFYPEAPWSLNSERSKHYHARAQNVKRWREAFWGLAKEQGIGEYDQIGIIAVPYLKRAQDVGNCLPSVKAAVDGLVDAKVVPDDGPKNVVYLLHVAPVMGSGIVGLQLIVDTEPQQMLQAADALTFHSP